MLKVLIILSACAIWSNAATCTMRYDAKNPGIFVRKFGSNRIFIIPNDGKLTIDDDMVIEGYCAGGFRGYYDYGANMPHRQLNFKCNGGNSITYQVPGMTYTQFSNNGLLTCSKPFIYSETNLTTCDYYGMEYGSLIYETSVILENVCYDLKTMQTKFIHYVAGIRTRILEHSFIPGNSMIASIDPVEISFDLNSVKNENSSIVDAVNTLMSTHAGCIQYQLEPLIRFNIAAGIIQSDMTFAQSTNMAAFWKCLKYGNWREVENAIENIALNGTYDVYTGTSGMAYYPYSGKCILNEPLTYKVDQLVRTIPLYIWTYVKATHSYDDEGVAIIGVNSPFFEASANASEALCDDQCDKYSWLHTVTRTRHFSSLGYVFCCKYDDVKDKLDGFPNLWYFNRTEI